MNKIFKSSFFLSLFFFSTNLLSGFAAGTKVKTPHGYTFIEQLQPGSIVYSITRSGNCCLSKVKKTTSYFLFRSVAISVGDDVIVAAPQQKFYDSEKNIWRKAKHLQKTTFLLSGHKKIVTINDIQLLDGEIEFFDIQLDDEYTFFVGTQEIVVHNFPPFFVGFSIVSLVGGLGPNCLKVARVKNTNLVFLLAAYLLMLEDLILKTRMSGRMVDMKSHLSITIMQGMALANHLGMAKQR